MLLQTNRSKTPTKPNLQNMLIISTVLGLMLVGETLLLYFFMVYVQCDDENFPLEIPKGFMPDETSGGDSCKIVRLITRRDGSTVSATPVPYCEMEVAMYYQLSLSIQLLLYVGD